LPRLGGQSGTGHEKLQPPSVWKGIWQRCCRRISAGPGYSRLIGIDEEGTLARRKAVRKALVDPTIAKRRGRIVKTTGEDIAGYMRAPTGAPSPEVRLRCSHRSISDPGNSNNQGRDNQHHEGTSPTSDRPGSPTVCRPIEQ
jgi:hypothetical protein